MSDGTERLSGHLRARHVRRGYAAYQKFYDVLPKTFEEYEPLIERPMAEVLAGRSFARSRAEVVSALAEAMRAARRLVAVPGR